MKKNIIAMAVAAAVAAPAAAMADTTLYGKIHASYNAYTGDTTDDHGYGLTSNSSRIGIKGKEEISDNLAFVYQWEATMDWGANVDKSDSGFGGQRNTFIGFSGDWGTAIAGRHDTPFKKVSRKYDMFGDTIGDSRAVLGNDGGWDRRLPNMVAYMTPDMGGFHATAGYVSDHEENNNNEGDAFSIGAGYGVGGFSIDAAYEQANLVNGDDADGVRVGAGYKMGGFKVTGLYQNVENFDGNDRDAFGLGAGYTFGKNTIKAQYYTADDIDNNADTSADLWAVGYDYKLSKQTNIYAIYAGVDADANSDETVGGGGFGLNGDVYDGTDTGGFSVGVVHKF